MANFKITWVAEQKEFSIEYMFKKRKWFIIRLNVNSRNLENLVLKLPKPPNNFGIQSVNNYYKKCNLKERLLFAKIESDKVFKILKNFDESKAPGIDDLSGIFLEDGASLLATPITQLCNLSISSGRFPDACKIAKLKPLLKVCSKSDPKNSRSISLLPLMSKVLERIVHEEIIEFLDKHNISYKFQSGF